MSSEDEPSGPQPGAGGEEPLVAPLGTGDAGQGSTEPPSEPTSTGASAASLPGASAPPRAEPSVRGDSPSMLPRRRERSAPERLFVRLVATCGIVGIGVAIAAIMASSKSQGWLVGLVVSIVSVILAAILWSSRVL